MAWHCHLLILSLNTSLLAPNRHCELCRLSLGYLLTMGLLRHLGPASAVVLRCISPCFCSSGGAELHPVFSSIICDFRMRALLSSLQVTREGNSLTFTHTAGLGLPLLLSFTARMCSGPDVSTGSSFWFLPPAFVSYWHIIKSSGLDFWTAGFKAWFMMYMERLDESFYFSVSSEG